jgi:DNA-binding response OmpR family regulator
MSDVAGISVLLVEDEYLIALDAEELLRDLGVKAVETVATFERAEKRAKEGAFDIAVLDVNINGRHSFPIAQTIRQRGIPVLFASGYELQDRPSPDLDDVVCVTKPYTGERLKAGLSAALAKHQLKPIDIGREASDPQ